ncbi:helix-turn-helix domain-containing protein [Hominifimenecus sp. rT4P-3]|uniref:helix-turn-helix domain-containing protein n=1 Tax=Hominifimenecus sp. rT4P-3 TaxID=3242979 RepID=UPI003DA6131E
MGFWVYFTEDKRDYYDSDACALYLGTDDSVSIVAHSKIIFDHLVINREIPISRSQIIAWVDGYEADFNPSDRGGRSPVDQAIRELRKKLGKYDSCIRTVRGIGYKYIGPPKVEKPKAEPEVPMSAEASGTISPGHLPAADSRAASPQAASVGSRHERVLANLEHALNRLVEAADGQEVQRARSAVKKAVERYAQEAAANFVPDLEGAPEDSGWELEASRHQIWLRRSVNYYQSLLESAEAGTELTDMKLDVLDYIRDVHICVTFLCMQLVVEQEALEHSGSQIAKEVRQSLIDTLRNDYRYAKAEAREADMRLDEKIEEYSRGLSADRSAI